MSDLERALGAAMDVKDEWVQPWQHVRVLAAEVLRLQDEVRGLKPKPDPTMFGNNWILSVGFGAFTDEQLYDGGQPYALRLAALCTKWEHDCNSDLDTYPASEGFNCPSLRRGYDYNGDLMWEVSEDLSTFTAYSDVIDALEDLMTEVVMNTIPHTMILLGDHDD